MTRDRAYLAVLAAVVAVALWFVLVWTPRSHDVDSAHARVAAADSSARKLRLDLVRLTAAKHDQAQTAATLTRLQVAVPDTADLAGLVTSVSDTAGKTGVRLAGITPGAPVVGSPTAIPFTLNVTGGYFPVVSFVRQLTSLPRLVVVDAVQVTSNANAADLTVSLTARAFTTQAVAG